jgi:hypothetical protein
MTIYLRKPASELPAGFSSSETVRLQPPSSHHDTSKAQAPAVDETVVTIDMKHKHSDEILRLFMKETRAAPVEPAGDDRAEMERLKQLRKQAAVDREKRRQRELELKKEEQMLERARKSAGLA